MPETHIASGKVREIYEIDDDRLLRSARERHIIDRGGALDPRQRADAAQHAVEERPDLRRRLVSALRKRHVHRQHVGRIEAGVDVSQRAERPQHDASAHQQDQRQQRAEQREQLRRTGQRPGSDAQLRLPGREGVNVCCRMPSAN